MVRKSLGEEGKSGVRWDSGGACLPHSLFGTSMVLVAVAAFGGLQPQAWPHCFSLSFPVAIISFVIIAHDLGKTVLL